MTPRPEGDPPEPMTRATAERRLLVSLGAIGFRSGTIDLPDIWPSLAAWWRTPVSDVAPEDDWCKLYLSNKPAAADPLAITVFASHAPEAIADRDFVRIDFEREFLREIAPDRRVGLEGGAVVTLWYEAGNAWDVLRGDPGWIDLGISTPNIDWCARGHDIARMIAELEQDAVFAVASRQRALALGFLGDETDELVVLARR